MYDDYVSTPRALWLGALIFCVIVITDSWFRWTTFQYATFDMAFYAQGLWLAGKGKWLVSLLGVPLMGNHQEPILSLILPFFKIWPHPMLLVIIQTVLLATMPFTGWRVARHLEFSPKASMWLALATLLAPATGFVALHEFHPEALAAPLILLMLEARLKVRPGLFWLWFLLVLACKENMALLLAWMCAVHYVLERGRDREWRVGWNIVPGVFALGWFLVCTLLIGPWLNHGNVDYLELYSHLGNSGSAILTGFFTEPRRAISAVLKALENGNLVWGILGPFLLLPLLRPRWLIVAMPVLAQHLLSWRPSEWTIHYHYAAPLLPLFWFGAVEAGAKLFWRDTLAGWMAIACALCQPWFGPAKQVWGTVAGAREAWRARAWKQEMLASIPSGASVTAGLPYLSHLANREHLHSLHHILKGLKTLSREDYKQPAPTDFVIVDTADRATFADGLEGYFHPRRVFRATGRIIPASDMLLHEYLLQAEWKKLSRNEVTIYIKGTPKQPDVLTGPGRKLDDNHTLLSIQAIPPLPRDAMLFRISWELQPGRQKLLWMKLLLKDASGRLFAIGKGPIGLDVASGNIVEAWAVRPPPWLAHGKYEGFILIYDPFESQVPPAQKQFKKVMFSVGEFNL